MVKPNSEKDRTTVFEEQFDGYIASVFNEPPNDRVKKELKRSFFAGCITAHRLIEGFCKLEPEERAAQMIDMALKELLEFNKDVQAGIQ